MSEAETVAKMARDGAAKAEVITIEHDGVKALLFMRPTGNGALSAESLKGTIDSFRERPQRRSGTATLSELDSFIDHANRFKDVDSAVFVVPDADDGPPKFMAMLDYHERVNVLAIPPTVVPPDALAATAQTDPDPVLMRRQKAALGTPLPRFGCHRGAYTPELSDEWKAWTQLTSPMPQSVFSSHIDTNAADLLDVTDREGALAELTRWYADRFAPAEMEASEFYGSVQQLLNLAEGLTMTIADKVADVTRRSGGGVNIAFASEIATSMEVPPAFVIAIPVFTGGDLYQLPVRMKVTAKTSGDTKRAEWTLAPYGVERVMKAAIEAAIAKVREGTGLPVFMGAPEA